MERFFNSETGGLIVSVVWGLGLAALFRQVCRDGSCIEVKPANPNEIRGKVWKTVLPGSQGTQCVRFTPKFVN